MCKRANMSPSFLMMRRFGSQQQLKLCSRFAEVGRDKEKLETEPRHDQPS